MSIWDRMFNFDNYGELLQLLQNSIIAGAPAMLTHRSLRSSPADSGPALPVVALSHGSSSRKSGCPWSTAQLSSSER